MISARLTSLQVARGIAALLVFFMHLLNLGAWYSGSASIVELSYWVQHLGHFGVDIFFVISGFVIARTATKSLDIANTPLSFFAKRVARVFPLFWITLGCLLLLPSIPGSSNSIMSLLGQPSSMFLLSASPTHPVAWTLVYEIQFYLLASFLMLFGSNTRIAFLIWPLVQIPVIILAKTGFLPQIAITDGLTLEFAFGVTLSLVAPKGMTKFPVFVLFSSFMVVAGTGIFVGLVPILSNSLLRTLYWGIPAVAVVMSLISMEQRGTKFPELLRHLGDMSYSLYMWHLIVLIGTAALLRTFFPTSTTAFIGLYFMLSTVLTLALSKLSYNWVEMPILRYLTSFPKKAPPAQLKPLI